MSGSASGVLGPERHRPKSLCGFAPLHFWSSLWAAVDSAVVVSTFSIRSAKSGCRNLGFSCFGYLKSGGM